MLRIDRKNNITLDAGDNAIIDVCLCNGEKLEEGDLLIFHSSEQRIEISEFTDGKGKIQIYDRYEPIDGTYCIYVNKKDGRKSQIASGKYIRKGGC